MSEQIFTDNYISMTIKHDGNMHMDAREPNTDYYSLIKNAVDGYFELVSIRCGDHVLDMYVNEEGLRLELPYNAAASRLYSHVYDIQDGVILGDAIILTTDEEGESIGLTLEQASSVVESLAMFFDVDLVAK